MKVAAVLVLLLRFLSGLDASAVTACAGGRCFQIFKQTEDFRGARGVCVRNGGRLLDLRGSEAAGKLPEALGGVTGTFWLELRGTDDKNCSSVSVTSDGKLSAQWKPCGEKLDGLLCQDIPECPCDRVDAGGGARLRYIAHNGGELSDALFPPGTVAEVKKLGEKYLDTKHLCYGGKWLRAPWNCEVLSGGCDHNCSTSTQTCICRGRSQLQPNGFSCGADPCAGCSHQCRKQGDVQVCACPKGYQLGPDGKTCLDVNECEDGGDEQCPGDEEECVNTPGGAECRCREGFELVDEECVDVSMCGKCEHLKCVKNNMSSKFECACREGFRVKLSDPTRCELFCPNRSCRADCVEKPPKNVTHRGLMSSNSKELQCYCPSGYIKDVTNGIALCTDVNECDMHVDQCEHLCVNTFGHFICSCHEGFELQNDTSCVRKEAATSQNLRSSTESVGPEPSPLPALVPPYVKTGSVLGITVFVLASVGLMCFLVKNMSKRCSSISLSTLSHSDINIFHLQQVTTETYKRLSVDKQMKSDVQKV